EPTASTPQGSSLFSTREKNMIKEINALRAKPSSYVRYIDQFLDVWNATKKERAVAQELKRELRYMEPVPPLEPSEALYRIAKNHGDRMKRSRKLKHQEVEEGAENLVAGNNRVRYAVVDLLIDFGVEDRGHRKNLLNPDFKRIACYEVPGKVGDYAYVFVQVFD
ncbi:MAG: CAP domain-containing protein, partial [Bacteroidota bacterium]